MKKLKYIIKRIRKLNYINFFKTIKIIHIKTKKTYIYIFIDIIYCGFKYLAGYTDYAQLEFYNLNKNQRKTIITRGINNNFVKRLNTKEYYNYLDDKTLFNKKYNKFLGRDWLDLRNSTFEEFKNFIKKYNKVIAKPINLSCGNNINIIEYNNVINIKNIYIKLLNNKQYLIEEYILQHNDLNKLYNKSVNTLRIVTILKDNKVYIPFICLRIGNNGNNVDNFNNEGLLAIVNKKGIIKDEALDKKGNIYIYHPFTNVKIINYKIPYFKESIKLAKKIAYITPQIKYTAWDIAITQNGPVVIEGNQFPGHDIYQSKITLKKYKIGLLPKFNKILNEN